MALNSKIEWTEASWNPVTGCTKISLGCKNCYAFRMAKRLHAMRNPRYLNNFNVTLHHDLLELPLKWKKSKRIFVNSMSDLFHEDIPEEYIREIFITMKKAYWHTFQILTKRSERLLKMFSTLEWSKNIWMGVTVENNDVVSRINDLKLVPAHIKFLSIEPMIGPINNLILENIDWVIVGGESGPGARPMDADWVRYIRDECVKQGVPFFFKQWGGVQKHRNGRILDEETWDQYPIK
jgi:protein gp37